MNTDKRLTEHENGAAAAENSALTAEAREPEAPEDEEYEATLSRLPDRCRGWLTSVAPVTVPPSRMLASPEQLTDNFLALLESIHDEDAFAVLELRHWWQFNRRRRMRRELQVLYAGLWHLALHRSFPQDYEAIFQVWKERTGKGMSRARRNLWEKRLQHYVDFMSRYGDRDFRALSRHMAVQVYADKADIKRIAFGLALHIRRIYTFLFEHLV